MNEHPGQAEDWLDKNFGFVLNPLDDIINKGPQGAGEWIHNQLFGAPEQPGHPDATGWSQMALGRTPYPASTPRNLSDALGSLTSPPGAPRASANQVDVQSSIANVAAGTVNLAGRINLPSRLQSPPHRGQASAIHGPGHPSWAARRPHRTQALYIPMICLSCWAAPALMTRAALLLRADRPAMTTQVFSGDPRRLGRRVRRQPPSDTANMGLLKRDKQRLASCRRRTAPQQSDPGPGGAPGLPSTGPTSTRPTHTGRRSSSRWAPARASASLAAA